jgi:hypothetical protein
MAIDDSWVRADAGVVRPCETAGPARQRQVAP